LLVTATNARSAVINELQEKATLAWLRRRRLGTSIRFAVPIQTSFNEQRNVQVRSAPDIRVRKDVFANSAFERTSVGELAAPSVIASTLERISVLKVAFVHPSLCAGSEICVPRQQREANGAAQIIVSVHNVSTLVNQKGCGRSVDIARAKSAVGEVRTTLSARIVRTVVNVGAKSTVRRKLAASEARIHLTISAGVLFNDQPFARLANFRVLGLGAASRAGVLLALLRSLW